MNWKRIKNILIILFAIINLFVIFTLYQSEQKKITVSTKTIEEMVSVLKKNSIDIDKELIPEKTTIIKAVVLKNAISSEEEFKKAVLNNGETPSNGRTVSIIGDEFTITDLYKPTNIEQAEKWLGSMGIDLSFAKGQKTESGYRFTQSFDGYPIFSSFIDVKVTNEGTTVLGSWAVPQKVKGSPAIDIKHVVSVFPNLIADETRPQKCTIIAVDLGYGQGAANGETYKESAAAPYWRITTADGREYFFEAWAKN